MSITTATQLARLSIMHSSNEQQSTWMVSAAPHPSETQTCGQNTQAHQQKIRELQASAALTQK
jgi:hypothetical protein